MTLLQAMLELKRLEAAINEKRMEFQDRNLVSASVVNESQDFTPDVSEEVDAVRKLWGELTTLMHTKANLQLQITAANARLGLDSLLSRRNVLKNDIKNLAILTARPRFGGARPKTSVTHTPWTADKTNYWKHDIQQFAVQMSEMEELLTLMKNELQELEVQIAALNNQPL